MYPFEDFGGNDLPAHAPHARAKRDPEIPNPSPGVGGPSGPARRASQGPTIRKGLHHPSSAYQMETEALIHSGAQTWCRRKGNVFPGGSRPLPAPRHVRSTSRAHLVGILCPSLLCLRSNPLSRSGNTR